MNYAYLNGYRVKQWVTTKSKDVNAIDAIYLNVFLKDKGSKFRIKIVDMDLDALLKQRNEKILKLTGQDASKMPLPMELYK